MRIWFVSVGIALVFGIIDILPMMIQKLEKKAVLSAFLQYFFVSIVIVNIDLPGIAWWLEGGLVSFALSLPVILIVSGSDRKAVPVIASMSLVLGTLIAVAAHFLK
jgi:hypothetical protein